MGDPVSHERTPAGQELGGVNWEIQFYEDVLKRKPDYVEVLMLLGGLYTGSKMYKQGLKVDERLAELKASDPIVQYNLACSYSLVNQVDKAIDALRKAVQFGYCDVDHMNHDDDLVSIRSDRRYAELLAGMRHSVS